MSGFRNMWKRILQNYEFNNIEYSKRCLDSYSTDVFTGYAFYKDKRIFFKISTHKENIIKEYDILNMLHKKGIDFIPKVLYFFDIENIKILVTEYIEGETLGDLMYGEEFINMAAESFEKLYRLYSEIGITHGDWHGSNIIIQKDTKKVYLIDFENSKTIADDLNMWKEELDNIVSSLDDWVLSDVRNILYDWYGKETYRESLDELILILRSGCE